MMTLGIGANTAIFTLINAVMWRTLPVKDPQRLLSVARRMDQTVENLNYRDYRAMRTGATLAELTAYAPVRLTVNIDGNTEPEIDAEMVADNYFALLAVNPLIGRAIGPDDDRVPNGHPVAMISYAYWTRAFARAPSVIGQRISILGTPFTIIGVTPPGFYGTEIGTASEIFIPLMMQPTVEPEIGDRISDPQRGSLPCTVLARAKPRVSPQVVEEQLESIYRRLNPPPKLWGNEFTDRARGRS